MDSPTRRGTPQKKEKPRPKSLSWGEGLEAHGGLFFDGVVAIEIDGDHVFAFDGFAKAGGRNPFPRFWDGGHHFHHLGIKQGMGFFGEIVGPHFAFFVDFEGEDNLAFEVLIVGFLWIFDVSQKVIGDKRAA